MHGIKFFISEVTIVDISILLRKANLPAPSSLTLAFVLQETETQIQSLIIKKKKKDSSLHVCTGKLINL